MSQKDDHSREGNSRKSEDMFPLFKQYMEIAKIALPDGSHEDHIKAAGRALLVVTGRDVLADMGIRLGEDAPVSQAEANSRVIAILTAKDNGGSASSATQQDSTEPDTTQEEDPSASSPEDATQEEETAADPVGDFKERVKEERYSVPPFGSVEDELLRFLRAERDQAGKYARKVSYSYAVLAESGNLKHNEVLELDSLPSALSYRYGCTDSAERVIDLAADSGDFLKAIEDIARGVEVPAYCVIRALQDMGLAYFAKVADVNGGGSIFLPTIAGRAQGLYFFRATDGFIRLGLGMGPHDGRYTLRISYKLAGKVASYVEANADSLREKVEESMKAQPESEEIPDEEEDVSRRMKSALAEERNRLIGDKGQEQFDTSTAWHEVSPRPKSEPYEFPRPAADDNVKVLEKMPEEFAHEFGSVDSVDSVHQIWGDTVAIEQAVRDCKSGDLSSLVDYLVTRGDAYWAIVDGKTYLLPTLADNAVVFLNNMDSKKLPDCYRRMADGLTWRIRLSASMYRFVTTNSDTLKEPADDASELRKSRSMSVTGARRESPAGPDWFLHGTGMNGLAPLIDKDADLPSVFRKKFGMYESATDAYDAIGRTSSAHEVYSRVPCTSHSFKKAVIRMGYAACVTGGRFGWKRALVPTQKGIDAGVVYISDPGLQLAISKRNGSCPIVRWPSNMAAAVDAYLMDDRFSKRGE